MGPVGSEENMFENDDDWMDWLVYYKLTHVPLAHMS